MMKRNLKALGLSLVAAMALGAVMASGASAEFTMEKGATSLRVSALEKQVIVSAGMQFNCGKLTFDGGPFAEVEKEITIEPTYSECEITVAGSTLTAQVDTNSCYYLFTTNTEVAFHILCPEGKQIEVTAKILGVFRKCLDLHAQTPTSPVVHYTNKLNTTTNKWDIELNPTINGITLEETGACGAVEENGLTYRGKITVEALNAAGEPTNITHSLFAGE